MSARFEVFAIVPGIVHPWQARRIADVERVEEVARLAASPADDVDRILVYDNLRNACLTPDEIAEGEGP